MHIQKVNIEQPTPNLELESLVYWNIRKMHNKGGQDLLTRVSSDIRNKLYNTAILYSNWQHEGGVVKDL